MRKLLIVSASLATLAFVPSLAFADVVTVEPDVESWVMQQPTESVIVDQDVIVGAVLPDTVQVIEVPKYKKYRFAVVNNKRVIVDSGTRKVIKVY